MWGIELHLFFIYFFKYFLSTQQCWACSSLDHKSLIHVWCVFNVFIHQLLYKWKPLVRSTFFEKHKHKTIKTMLEEAGTHTKEIIKVIINVVDGLIVQQSC